MFERFFEDELEPIFLFLFELGRAAEIEELGSELDPLVILEFLLLQNQTNNFFLN